MRTVWDAVRDRPYASHRDVAIRGAREISYGELGELVADLCERIKATSPPGSLIALDAAEPAAGAIAILAAARAERAILPLSQDMPAMLRDAVLADAGPEMIIAQQAETDFTIAPYRGTPGREQCGRDLRDVAYVLYTSGSTGRPKGVMVPHGALVPRLAGLADVPGLRRGEAILAMTALSFDIALAELLLPLIVGASFIAAPPGTRLDPAVFADTTSQYGPDVIQATPSFWRLALAWGWQGAPGARLWCGGEALTGGLAERLLPRCRELWNVYGPTEATIWATAGQVRAGHPVSLGAPLPGSGLCLEDTAGGRARMIGDAGRPGEILLYGSGLAAGYLNGNTLTKERFCERETPDGPQRCYRTGDRAQFREDGSVEFLGRTDAQVKLRGHRFELGDVEDVLEQCAGVTAAAVVIRDKDQPERASLVAFLVTDGFVTARAVREWTGLRLPPIMRPGHIYFQSSLPRTTAGKVDRVRLAETAQQTRDKPAGPDATLQRQASNSIL